jgi:hypothetical protein
MARWALYSKEPGDTCDYHILATSGTYPDDAYEAAIRRALPGNPPIVGQRGPEDLPWVTFGPDMPDEQ